MTTLFRLEHESRPGRWSVCRSDGLDEIEGLRLLAVFRAAFPGERYRLVKATTEEVERGGETR